MEMKLEIPEYTLEKGIQFKWENGFDIEIKYRDGVVTLMANKAGLISLANHFLNLAQEKIPAGYHMHFDEYNSLEEGSVDMLVEKK